MALMEGACFSVFPRGANAPHSLQGLHRGHGVSSPQKWLIFQQVEGTNTDDAGVPRWLHCLIFPPTPPSGICGCVCPSPLVSGGRRISCPVSGLGQSPTVSLHADSGHCRRSHFKHPGRQEKVCFTRRIKGSVRFVLLFPTATLRGVATSALKGSRLLPEGSRALISSSSLKGDAPYLRSSLRWI